MLPKNQSPERIFLQASPKRSKNVLILPKTCNKDKTVLQRQFKIVRIANPIKPPYQLRIQWLCMADI